MIFKKRLKETKTIKSNIPHDKRIKAFIHVCVHKILFKKAYDTSYYVP